MLQTPLLGEFHYVGFKRFESTSYCELTDRTRGIKALKIAPEQKAFLLFTAFITFIREKGWVYNPSEGQTNVLDFAASEKIEVNCVGLREALLALFKAHGISNAELHRYYPRYGHSIALKVPGRTHPAILGTYECFDKSYNQKFIKAGKVEVSRHYVVTLPDSRLFFDPTFSCTFEDPNAIIECHDCIDSHK